MIKIFELVKEIAPGILTALIIAFLFWTTTRFKKMLILLNQLILYTSDNFYYQL
jgi:hypothetical protein